MNMQAGAASESGPGSAKRTTCAHQRIQQNTAAAIPTSVNAHQVDRRAKKPRDAHKHPTEWTVGHTGESTIHISDQWMYDGTPTKWETRAQAKEHNNRATCQHPVPQVIATKGHQGTSATKWHTT